MAGLAGLLLAVGLGIIAAPPAWRRLKGSRGVRPPASPPRDSSPPRAQWSVSARALNQAEALVTLLRQQGALRQAAALSLASRRLRLDEARGLYAMQQVLRQCQGLVLRDATAQARFVDLVRELQHSVADRCEQLELLPRP